MGGFVFKLSFVLEGNIALARLVKAILDLRMTSNEG